MSNLATITNNILADSGIDDINVVVTNGSYANPAWITSLAWIKITGAPTIVTSVTASSPLFSSGGTTPNITIQQASGSQNGFLSSTDWTTFNNKQNALTNPVTGTGTTNYLPKWSSSSALTNSILYEVNDSIGVGYSNPIIIGGYSSLDIRGTTGGVIQMGDTSNQISGRYVEIVANSTRFFITTFNSKPLVLGINGAQNVILTAAGNLLVGPTGDSGYKLDVGGDIFINGNFSIKSANNGHIFLKNITAEANSWIYQEASSDWGMFAVNNNSQLNALGGIFSGAGLSTFITSSAAVGVNLSSTTGGGSSYGAIAFVHGSGDAYFQGRIGVGTFAPSQKLDVRGTIFTNSGGTERYFQMLGYNNSYATIRSNVGFSSAYNSLNFLVNVNSDESTQGNTSIPSWIMSLGGNIPDSDSFYIQRSGGGSFSFTNLFKLTAAGAATFSSSVTAAGLYFTSNDTPQTVQGTITRHSVVGLVSRGVTSAVFDWSVYSAGGTALIVNPTGSNNISFPSGQVLFTGGNVLIGTTTDNGARLQVSGTGTFAGVGFGSNGIQTSGANGGNGIYSVAGGSAGSGVYGFTNDLSSFAGTFQHTGAGAGIALRVIGWSTFSQAATFSSSVRSNDVNAFLLSQTGNTTDTKTWSIQNLPTSGQFRIRALNDSETNGINALVISRTGISSVSLDFGGAATFSSTIRSNATNGLGLGSIPGYRRIQYDTNGTKFGFLTDGDALANLEVNSATFSGSVTAGGDVNLESNESYLNLFSTYVVGMNARARIRAVGAGGGSGYGGDFRVSTRATNNVWNNDVFVIDYRGYAGVGLAAPNTRLHVVAATEEALRLHKSTGGGAGMLLMSTDFAGGNTYAISPYINGVSNGGFSIKDITNNTDRIVIAQSTGWVGINVNVPATPFHASGSATFTNSVGIFLEDFYSSGGYTKVGSKYQTTNNCRAEVRFINPATGTDSDLSLAVSDTANNLYNAMYIKGSNGAVMMGSTTTFHSPRLTVNGKVFLQIGANTDIGGAVYAYNDTANGVYFGGLKFQYFSNASGSYTLNDGMVMNGLGNVGINNMAPSFRLDVNGSARFSNTIRIDGYDSVGGQRAIGFGGNTLGTNPVIYSNGSYLAINSKTAELLYLNDSVNGTVAIATGGGNVGIGTTSTAGIVEISRTNTNIYPRVNRSSTGYEAGWKYATGGTDSWYIGLRNTDGTGSYHFYSYTTNSSVAQVTAGGDFLIGYTGDQGAYLLQVNGAVFASSYFESSDVRLKTIFNKHNSFDFGAIEYKWKDNRDEKLHWGYSAQEVMNWLPDAVNKNEDGYLTLDYNQAHTYKIAMLEKRINELEQQLKNK